MNFDRPGPQVPADDTSAGAAPGMFTTGHAQYRHFWQRSIPPIDEVRPGVWSLPIPIVDSPLPYTLCYLLEDTAGPVLIDPGMPGPEAAAAMKGALDAAGYAVGDVAGVVVTHSHPDHHGLSRWVAERSDAWVGLHADEADLIASRQAVGIDDDADQAWLGRCGVPVENRPGLRPPEAMLGLLRRALPASRRFVDGDLLPLRDHRVRVVHTPGHTRGHLCLHHETEDLFFSGDHVLPRISPHLGVHGPDEPPPLAAYRESLRRVARFETAEVLPGHEWRFVGLPTRIEQLLRHHDDRCNEIVDQLVVAEPLTAWQVTALLTWSRGWASIHGMAQRSALAETLAHLCFLQQAGAVTATEPADDAVRYQAAA